MAMTRGRALHGLEDEGDAGAEIGVIDGVEALQQDLLHQKGDAFADGIDLLDAEEKAEFPDLGRRHAGGERQCPVVRLAMNLPPSAVTLK